MFVRNRFAFFLLLPAVQACAYASTDGFIEEPDGSGGGPSPSTSGGNSSVGGPPSGGSTSTGGSGPIGTATGGGSSSADGGNSGFEPGPNPFPFPTFPGPGTSSGGNSGSGGSSGSAGNTCMMVTCGGGTYPKPTGDVCFSFTTTQFGGWQVSNPAGCMMTFDGTVTPTPGVNPTSAGAHELEFSGCTSVDVSWSCWN
jgi:hypothetical protein